MERKETIKHIGNSILKAMINISKLNITALNVYGLTSYKIKHLLNNINDFKNINYLEIGVFSGSTFIAATYQNNLNSCYAIDNWSESYGLGHDTKTEFKQNCDKFDVLNYNFFETNCFNFDLSNITNKINCYFYDGNHEYKSQYDALTYYYPILDDEFIFMVDDFDPYNEKWAEVERGTRDSIKDLNLNILYENHLRSSGRNDVNTWWNGFYVSYLKKTLRC